MGLHHHLSIIIFILLAPPLGYWGFSHKLLARGYTQTEINNGTHNVSLTNRTKLIHNLPQGKQNMEAPLVFLTTYNPFVNHKDVKQAIYKHWHLIQQNPQLSEIFPKQLFVAFRKKQNIREKLIRAKLTSTDPNRSTEITTSHSHDSGFFEEPDETLNILLSLLEEQIT